jgi:hypothetical protein
MHYDSRIRLQPGCRIIPEVIYASISFSMKNFFERNALIIPEMAIRTNANNLLMKASHLQLASRNFSARLVYDQTLISSFTQVNPMIRHTNSCSFSCPSCWLHVGVVVSYISYDLLVMIVVVVITAFTYCIYNFVVTFKFFNSDCIVIHSKNCFWFLLSGFANFMADEQGLESLNMTIFSA